MSHSDRLRLKDLRTAYRLIGECRELGHDPNAWRLHMLQGLQGATGAQLALSMQIDHLGTDDEEISAPLAVGLMDHAQRTLWSHYQAERAHRDDLFHQRYYGRFTGRLLTRKLDSVVEPREWCSTRHYNEYIRPCGLNDRITSSLRLSEHSPSSVQVIVLHRSQAEGQYSRRAVRLVHLFHHELSMLLGHKLQLPLAHRAEPPLPAQLQHVLAGLLVGESEKQVARRLAISHHTVNRHVQRLYRRFGVHSRGELMFHCRGMLPGLLNSGK